MKEKLFIAVLVAGLVSCDDNRPNEGSNTGPGNARSGDTAAMRMNQTPNSTDIGGDTTRGKRDSANVNR